MYKLSFLAALISLVCLSCKRTEPQDSAAPASARELRFDAGTVPQNDRLTHSFKITNDSDASLNITDVKKSCGCTTPTLKTRHLNAHESTDVRVDIVVGDLSRKADQTVLLSTDSKTLKRFVLSVEYQVTSGPLDISPKQVRFGKVVAGISSTTRLSVTRKSHDTPLSVQSTSKWLTARVESAPDEEPGIISITLESNVPVGPMSDIVTIRTGANLATRTVIPVTATVLDNVYTDPSVLSLGTLRSDESRFVDVFVYERTPRGSHIGEVHSSVNLVTVAMQSPTELPGPQAAIGRVRVLVDARQMGPGPLSGSVSISTISNDPVELRLPLSLYVLAK